MQKTLSELANEILQAAKAGDKSLTGKVDALYYALIDFDRKNIIAQKEGFQDCFSAMQTILVINPELLTTSDGRISGTQISDMLALRIGQSFRLPSLTTENTTDRIALLAQFIRASAEVSIGRIPGTVQACLFTIANNIQATVIKTSGNRDNFNNCMTELAGAVKQIKDRSSSYDMFKNFVSINSPNP